MLLAIDTSAGCDVAVVSDQGRVLGEYREPSARHHAEAIGLAIAGALEAAGIGPADVTGVVCGMGPGPFTGLRVGVAAARTFAFAHRLPLHPLPSHDAIAHEWRHAHPADEGELIVTTDARRRELALSRYAAGSPVAASGFTLVAPDAVPDDATRADAHEVSAAHLALAWLERRERGLPEATDEILYLRAPDAKPGAVPKRVTA
ncbi:tRNA (adenosine(37)-N6)-threonylcarbamoyltransferase complex dimerization subunit type 1 TsaB [Gulosibacter faecalis]|uniref:tRNA (Adenosine(37)-N6)-threonylcarbamoyltransferase complex dimerization subunit type 1 TsaB n=1 Tax=Gulosibacter faecalis TaxID=272240 RepID=A0ABW5UTW0_9MICO|nr:tRNA (adenosine(37)-N6)-threonylcarbamoyltransferase complex dimerization subunit type 1 TsaB [Gulosibacter faecalis]